MGRGQAHGSKARHAVHEALVALRPCVHLCLPLAWLVASAHRFAAFASGSKWKGQLLSRSRSLAAGGANVPALNDLLVPFGAAFESGALESQVSIEGLPGQGPFHMASGVPIKALPAGAWLHRTPPKQKEGARCSHRAAG